MVASGWLEVEERGVNGGRKRKVYHVLPAGREELRRWVVEPGSSGENNEAFMVKMRADAVIGPLGLRDELERLIRWHEERLAIYQSIEVRDFGQPTKTRAQRLQHQVLRKGISAEEDWLDWAREALELL